jgi:hypothetical protein
LFIAVTYITDDEVMNAPVPGPKFDMISLVLPVEMDAVRVNSAASGTRDYASEADSDVEVTVLGGETAGNASSDAECADSQKIP